MSTESTRELLPMHPAVERALGLKKSAIHMRIAAGLCVTGVSVGTRSVRYPSDEVRAVADAYVAGFDDGAIRALVVKLHAARTQRVNAVTASV